MKAEVLWYKSIKVVFSAIAWGAAFAAVAIVIWQTSTWLRSATWNPYTIGDAFRDVGWSYPYLPQLLGVQKMIDVVLTWPASAIYFVIAVVAGFAAMWALEAESAIELKERWAQREKERAGKPETLADVAAEIENLLGKKER